MVEMPELTRRMKMQKVVVPVTAYFDQLQGILYERPGYEVKIAENLARLDNGDFTGELKRDEIIEFLAKQELQLPASCLLFYFASTDRNAKLLKDYFGRNPERTCYREHTGTKLVTPAGWESDRKDNGKYLRDVFEYRDNWRGKGDWIQVAEGVLVPDNGKIIGVNQAIGLPAETTNIATGHMGNWYFNPSLSESAVLFGGYNSGRNRYFDISANTDPSYTDGYLGFRPAWGCIPIPKAV